MISKKSVDPRMKKLVDSLGLNHEISSDGAFEINFALENNRSQTVTIESKTQKFNDLEIRDIYSVAAAIPFSEFTLEIAYTLLNENYRTKFGSWSAEKTESMVVIVFNAKVAADIDKESLESVLEMVMCQADRMEEIIHQEDNF